jgi:hypothetical protein
LASIATKTIAVDDIRRGRAREEIGHGIPTIWASDR